MDIEFSTKPWTFADLINMQKIMSAPTERPDWAAWLELLVSRSGLPAEKFLAMDTYEFLPAFGDLLKSFEKVAELYRFNEMIGEIGTPTE